jgi:hypothetical protein
LESELAAATKRAPRDRNSLLAEHAGPCREACVRTGLPNAVDTAVAAQELLGVHRAGDFVRAVARVPRGRHRMIASDRIADGTSASAPAGRCENGAPRPALGEASTVRGARVTAFRSTRVAGARDARVARDGATRDVAALRPETRLQDGPRASLTLHYGRAVDAAHRGAGRARRGGGSPMARRRRCWKRPRRRSIRAATWLDQSDKGDDE